MISSRLTSKSFGLVGITALLTTLQSPAADQPLHLVGQIGGGTLGVTVNKNIAYMAAGPRVILLDVSQSSAPRFISQTEPVNRFFPQKEPLIPDIQSITIS